MASQTEGIIETIRISRQFIRSVGASLPLLLVFIAGTALPAISQQQDGTKDRDRLRIHQEDQVRIMSQDYERAQTRLQNLEHQRIMLKHQVRVAEQAYGKKSVQAREARLEMGRNRQQIREAKGELKRVRALGRDRRQALRQEQNCQMGSLGIGQEMGRSRGGAVSSSGPRGGGPR